MSLEEFFDELTRKPIESQLVEIKLRYDHENKYRHTNELLLVDENCEYCWLNDWNEGETDIEVVAYIPVSDIEIPKNND